jgi:hypothetical protein
MKKSSVWVALLLMLGLLVGCATQVAEKATEAQIEAQTGGNADVDINSGKMTVETDDAKVTVETNAKEMKGWCDAGTQWKYAATTDQGNANAQWKVVGLMDSGEYKGLCHVVYEGTGPNGEKSTMDYYFTEDGESGYFEMNVNGQKFKQEWSKE